jgi:hypothetical protein
MATVELVYRARTAAVTCQGPGRRELACCDEQDEEMSPVLTRSRPFCTLSGRGTGGKHNIIKQTQPERVTFGFAPRPSNPQLPTFVQLLLSVVGAILCLFLLILILVHQMSTSQKLQQHPVFVQASNKANFYVSQLDKEVGLLFILPGRPF